MSTDPKQRCGIPTRSYLDAARGLLLCSGNIDSIGGSLLKTHSFVALALVSIAALPAAAGSVTDGNYTISASSGATQFDTTQTGAADFANSANLASYPGSLITPVATITGGQLNAGTNPDSGFTGSGTSIANWITADSGSSITITFKTAENYFGLLWGSMDPTNTITFYNGTTLIASYTGAQLSSDGSGAGLYPAGASYINFNAASVAKDFTKIVLSESSTDFEVDNLATGTAPVPLPASAYLLLAGLGLLGFSARKRKLAI